MDIKKLVKMYTLSCKTNNPFKIAKKLNIDIYIEPLGQILGFYDAHFRCSIIHLNQDIPNDLKNYVCAHELGHAIMHKHINTPYLKAHTFFSTNKIEKQANIFAVELLLPDDYLQEYPDTSIECLAKCKGVPIKLLELKNITR